ncbi:hypothetical protein ABZ599_12205 [Streptomyces misionensis]|uniref:hypothetical protein n=1 Tax=Streptomyces misionensis TaxID=67331 RepID=UPI0033D07791
MRRHRGARTRVVLACAGVLALALASPAMAASAAPTTPTGLLNGGTACATDAGSPAYVAEGLRGLSIAAVPGDTDPADDNRLSLNYRLWPVSDPALTSTLSRPAVVGAEAGVDVPTDDLADGQTYAWQAQTVVEDDASDWSAPCYVTIDDTHPPTPVVSSSNYPEGQLDQGGEPVRFTFGANGASDVVGFEFGWQQDLPVPASGSDPYHDDPANFVRADGGTATVALVPPAGVGSRTLYVSALDRAGNPSMKAAEYSFMVASTAPTITPATASPEFGEKDVLTLTPDPALEEASPVVGYSVTTVGGRHDGTTTVEAAADGTARLPFTFDGVSGERVEVSSKSADGWVSDTAVWYAWADTTPTVRSADYPENGAGGGAGVPGTFTFEPKVKGVVSYTYSFDWGGTEQTVDAEADGTAAIAWTPPDSGSYAVNVYATTADGIQLATCTYFFDVN